MKASSDHTSQGTIVAVGDSLTAGYGVDSKEAYPALLEQKLKEAGYRWHVVNAGISGETSGEAASRLHRILALKPDVVILETGANDGLRGMNVQGMRSNIEKMVRTLKEKGVTVILAGMKMFSYYGTSYTQAFSEVYTDLAKKYDLVLMPFFLEGVAGKAALNQSDSIHPSAQGYRVITGNIYPYVTKAISRHRATAYSEQGELEVDTVPVS